MIFFFLFFSTLFPPFPPPPPFKRLLATVSPFLPYLLVTRPRSSPSYIYLFHLCCSASHYFPFCCVSFYTFATLENCKRQSEKFGKIQKFQYFPIFNSEVLNVEKGKINYIFQSECRVSHLNLVVLHSSNTQSPNYTPSIPHPGTRSYKYSHLVILL